MVISFRRGMDIRTILSTEMRLLEPICSFHEEEGYMVYRSEKFPNYYGGNGIEIRDPRGMSLAGWEDIFHRYFDPARFSHLTFTFADGPEFAGIINDARRARYNVVELTSFMFAETTAFCRPLPEELEIRKVESDDDWERFYRFYHASLEEGDHYDPAYTGPDRLFEKIRFTTDAVGIEWFRLTRRGSDEIFAKLGIFRHGGICRLQDVETAPAHRRNGYAGLLVSFAIGRAIDTFGSRGLALCADSEYYAVDLYRKLGFAECGDTVMLMNYPIRNPAFMATESER
ncbi:MAG: GNAT family N-acetyltransferase [Candidatus Kapaibacterium sp.]